MRKCVCDGHKPTPSPLALYHRSNSILWQRSPRQRFQAVACVHLVLNNIKVREVPCQYLEVVRHSPVLEGPGKNCLPHEKDLDLRFAGLEPGCAFRGRPKVLGKPSESPVHSLRLACTTMQPCRAHPIAPDRADPGPSPWPIRARILSATRPAGPSNSGIPNDHRAADSAQADVAAPVCGGHRRRTVTQHGCAT